MNVITLKVVTFFLALAAQFFLQSEENRHCMPFKSKDFL